MFELDPWPLTHDEVSFSSGGREKIRGRAKVEE
jgi:hypothetical protein